MMPHHANCETIRAAIRQQPVVRIGRNDEGMAKPDNGWRSEGT